MLRGMTITARLDGLRVLLTQADDFMGPTLADVFTAQGATVIADTRPLADDPAAAATVVADAGQVDVLPPAFSATTLPRMSMTGEPDDPPEVPDAAWM